MLEEIVKSKRAEVEQAKRERPVDRLLDELRPSDRDFQAAIGRRRTGFVLECKRRSPSQGTIREGADPVDAIIRTALDSGINLVDTADMYAAGQNEEIVGRAIAGRRDDVVLCTKFHHPVGGHDDPNRRGNSRRWIMQAVDDSLRRLGVDHIDLYQAHRPDPTVALDETVGALTDLVRCGKIRAWGTSTFPAEDIVELRHRYREEPIILLRPDTVPDDIPLLLQPILDGAALVAAGQSGAVSVAAFAPLLTVAGTTGKIMRVIPLIVIPCLLWSLVESLWILPAHLSHYRAKTSEDAGRGLAGPWRRFQSRFADGLQWLIHKVYSPSLEYALRSRKDR